MIDSLTFRELSEDDLDAVLQIENLSFDTPWSRNQFKDEFLNRDLSIPIGVELDGSLVGYAFLWIIVDECHLANIAIHPDLRRRGIGQALIEHVTGVARAKNCVKMMLEVRKSNRSAIALYEKLGFQKTGSRKNYYHDGFLKSEDAILMDFEVNRQAL